VADAIGYLFRAQAERDFALLDAGKRYCSESGERAKKIPKPGTPNNKQRLSGRAEKKIIDSASLQREMETGR
jgi:hypothetical protein